MPFINSSTYLYPNQIPDEVIVEGDSREGSRLVRQTGYVNLPTNIREAIQRGELFYLGVEFYLPTQDEIWAKPNTAVFCFSDSRFTWQNRVYKDSIKAIPELAKYIGKQFNTMVLDMVNVQRGKDSGSYFAFKNMIRGFRVGVRMIFPNLGIQESRLIWWGRVAKVEDITETSLKINCSQEIGDFSYELAKDKYGSACGLFFGRGDCLGNEALAEKSLLYQNALAVFGQGGCNRTIARCIQLHNDKFYQGQKVVTIAGQFIRETVQKVGWWIFKRKKTTRTPVPFSSKNQSENDGTVIGLAFGRTQVELHPFTWVDTGENIFALLGASKGEIQGFYNITCRNPNLQLLNVTQHLGELGGVGTQQPDPRFPASGYNSRLAYLGAAYGGSPPADEPEEVPTTTAVLKAMIIPVRDKFGVFTRQWSYNPVWITRFLMTNYEYTVIRPEWFNDDKNFETADYCFNVVEDDTNAEVAVISANSRLQYEQGLFQRYAGVGRVNALTWWHYRQLDPPGGSLGRQIVLPPDEPLIEGLDRAPLVIDDDPVDIEWGDGLGGLTQNIKRTYLQFRYTANGRINETSKLTDVLFSLVLPTFKGFLRFNHFGQIEIDCRKPADNTYVRVNTDSPPVGGEEPTDEDNLALATTEIGVASVRKFQRTYGYLLIGVGLATAEIARIRGIRYVNGSAHTTVTTETTHGINMETTDHFIPRASAPSEIIIDFSGEVSAGAQMKLTFTEPNGDVLSWDYFADSDTDTIETVTEMFRVRLMASPSFQETWTAEVFPDNRSRLYVRCQTGYIKLDRRLQHPHYVGEEILRVVEVYEDGKDDSYSRKGIRDNITDFTLNANRGDTYHGATSTYISAVQDFRETIIQPRIAWDAAEQERNLNLLELDLRFVDNYRQAAFLTKSAAIQFVDGNLPANLTTGILALYHEEGDVIAVRHQTMEGISYTPFTVENVKYSHDSQKTTLELNLYLSAMFDERIAKEEKFLDSTLTPNSDPQVVPPPTLNSGGYSSTRTGDGAGDTENNVKYEPQKYQTFPQQQRYSPHGRDTL